VDRLAALLERYGTRAAEIAEHEGRGDGRRLEHAPTYSVAEITWIVQTEKVRRLDDIVLRRTSMALLGEVTMPLLEELAGLWTSASGRPDSEAEAAVAAAADHLRQRFGISLQKGQPA
jgi:glycerol-3-phosphate dehydrogenase